VDAELTLRRAGSWLVGAALAAVVWFGPPILYSIYMVAAGVWVLLWGPRWFKLWLATCLGACLVTVGIVAGLAVLV
jgi:hypothetical protein